MESFVTKMNRELDDGPCESAFTKLLAVVHYTKWPEIFRNLMLLPTNGHFEELLPCLKQLQNLLDEFDALPKDTTTMLIRHSVATFVFTSTHCIEHTGCASLSDTESILENRKLDKVEDNQNATHDTFNLLKEIYNPSYCNRETLPRLVPESTSVLLKWHKTLVGSNEEDHPGILRSQGAYTFSSINKKDIHKYPNHKVLEKATENLCRGVWLMADSIAKKKDSTEQLFYIFSLAAFFQFHLVDLHPFKDGNGRMCRIVAKQILDCFLPAPIPMFYKRKEYFRCLHEGRHGPDPRQSHIPLLHLLVHTAKIHYSMLLTGSTNLLIACDDAELYDVMNKCAVSESHREEIWKLFRSLSNSDAPHKVTPVTIEKTRYALLWMPLIKDDAIEKELEAL